MTTRTKHTYQTYLYDFIKDILVVCPQCNGKALVKTGDFTMLRFDIQGVRVVCGQCGYSKELNKISRKHPSIITGVPIDPFFFLPVWLKADFGSDLLWAYNLEHLDFLEQHVGAKLRERNGQPYKVRSIGARLPRWMTSKKNREAVLKAIEKLRATAES